MSSIIPSNPHGVVDVNGYIFDTWTDKSMIKQITVQLTTDKASEGLFRVFDPDFRFLDSLIAKDGIPSYPMEFWLGFGGKGNLSGFVFKGLLARVQRDRTDTTLIAYDMAYKMRDRKRTEYHKKLTSLGIIEKLARRNGLEFSRPHKPIKLPKHKSYIQRAQNDWETVSEIAQDIGLVLYVRGDTLYAQEAAHTSKEYTGKDPILTLSNRKDFHLLGSFDAIYRLPENIGGRPKEVEARGRGRGGKRLAGKSAKHKTGVSSIVMQRDLAIHEKSYADRRARADKSLLREHAFSLRVRMIPKPNTKRPDVRDVIEIENIGEFFSGRYLCDTVTHDLVPGNLVTDLELYRDIDEG